MAGFDPTLPIEIKELKDGRRIFKTHNGFRCYLTDQRGATLPVTQDYYTKLSRL